MLRLTDDILSLIEPCFECYLGLAFIVFLVVLVISVIILLLFGS